FSYNPLRTSVPLNSTESSPLRSSIASRPESNADAVSGIVPAPLSSSVNNPYSLLVFANVNLLQNSCVFGSVDSYPPSNPDKDANPTTKPGAMTPYSAQLPYVLPSALGVMLVSILAGSLGVSSV